MITGRMTGMIVFNPLLGRRGVPGLVKGGLALLLSISVYAITPSGPEMPATVLGLALTFLMELFLGYVHHTLIRIFASSGLVVPFGAVALGETFYAGMIQIFLDCTILGVKLAMPILAAELMGQVGMGILMKAIPQINVFAINIELKVIIGLVMLLILLVPISGFLLDAEVEMLLAVQRVLPLMSG